MGSEVVPHQGARPGSGASRSVATTRRSVATVIGLGRKAANWQRSATGRLLPALVMTIGSSSVAVSVVRAWQSAIPSGTGTPLQRQRVAQAGFGE